MTRLSSSWTRYEPESDKLKVLDWDFTKHPRYSPFVGVDWQKFELSEISSSSLEIFDIVSLTQGRFHIKTNFFDTSIWVIDEEDKSVLYLNI